MWRGAIIFLFIGLALGGVGGWFGPGLLAKPEPKPTTTVPAGFKTVTVPIPSGGLELTIRETDTVARLKNDDKIIGYKVVDSFAKNSGASLDIVTERLADFYDRPEATDLAAYKEPISGLTIHQTKETSIDGHPAFKQLYDATLGQKRSDGAVIKKPVTNLLRYVIDGPGHHFLFLKTAAPFQTYLDTVAISLRFVAAPASGDPNAIDLGPNSSINDILPSENPQVNGGEAIGL